MRSQMMRLEGGKRVSIHLTEECVSKEHIQRSWGGSCPSKQDEYEES